MIATAFGFPLELGHVAIVCGLVAAGIVARAWWGTREPPDVRRRRKALLEHGRSSELLPWRAWTAIARVVRWDLELLEERRANAGELPLRDLLSDLVVDWDPPAAGPEAELRWAILASTPEHAEVYARRRLGRLDLGCLALRIRRRTEDDVQEAA